MRLVVLLLALPLAACGGFDCPSLGPFNTVDAFQRLSVEPVASDTLVVVVESAYYIDRVYAALGADVPLTHETDAVEVLVAVEYSNYEATAERVPQLSAQASGDTVVVRAPEEFVAAAPPCAEREGVVQAVCSYAEPRFVLFFDGVAAPPSVRHVTYLWRDSFGRLAPLSRAASATEARALGARRTARG